VRLFGEERRRLKIVPNAFGEKPVLKLMFAALIRAAESSRGLRFTEFDLRQLEAGRKELDADYETSIARSDRDISAVSFQQVRALPPVRVHLDVCATGEMRDRDPRCRQFDPHKGAAEPGTNGRLQERLQNWIELMPARLWSLLPAVVSTLVSLNHSLQHGGSQSG
jgi:hypothetical protein